MLVKFTCYMCTMFLISSQLFQNISHADGLQITAIYGEKVILKCNYNTSSTNDRRWTYEDYELFRERTRSEELFQNSVSLDSNYSIVIDSVTIKHEGKFKCLVRSVETNAYILLVQG